MTVAYLDRELAVPEPRVAREPQSKHDYTLDYKRITFAYATEIVIALGSLYGAWLFAESYGHDDAIQIQMMMLAPIAYAIVEICRVPLALSVRTNPSKAVRILAAVGIFCAAGVTIKSMSQLGEMMFRPRLFDVVHTKETLNAKKSERATLDDKISAADAVVQQRTETLQSIDERLKSDTTQLSALPKQDCSPISGTNRNGRRWQSVRCTPDPRVKTLGQHLAQTTGSRETAQVELNKAVAERAAFDPTTVDQEISAAEVKYQEAVLHSQLHSFAAMVFGKATTEVTDAEIHQFLRVFVFVPAVLVAFMASLVALTAVVKHPPASIEIDEDAGSYILGPFVRTILEEAHTVAENAANRTLDKARQAQQGGN